MSKDKPSVGFIGLGNMGGPMAVNLVAGGFGVSVFDLEAARMTAVVGATMCSSAMDAANGVDILVSMLPAGRHVRALYLGDDSRGADVARTGLLDALSPRTLVIDCSTIDPESAIAVAKRGAELGIDVLDAPVSGGTGGAEAGTLTFIVGGAETAVQRAQSILQCMGSKVMHAGVSGAGQMAKICNNMLLAVQMAGTAEALALGVDNGLDPAVLSQIMQASSGGNWTLNGYNPYPTVMADVPASRGYTGGFYVDLMSKDLGLAMQAAQTNASRVPLGALAQRLYEEHGQTNEAGQLDFSSIQWLYKPQLRD